MPSSSGRCRLSDNTPAAPASKGAKQGSQDQRTPRRKKVGKTYTSTVFQDSEAEKMAAVLESGAGGGKVCDERRGGKMTTSRSSVGQTVTRASDDDGAGSSGPKELGLDGREHFSADNWPEECWFEDESAGMAAAGVERMIYLDHKDCLLSTHSDRRVRVWSTRKSQFLQRLELVGPVVSVAQEEPWSLDPTCSEKCSDVGDEKVAGPLVNRQTVAVTALYSDGHDDSDQGRSEGRDTAGNRWLFTGDVDGNVRVWDLAPFNPGRSGPPQRYLMLLYEFQPHQKSVTQLQQFELDGQIVVMSASVDCTIALCTIQGERIGTFSGKGPHWRLAEPQTWCSSPPPLDEGPRLAENDDGWGFSPRHRPGKGRGAAGSAGGPGAAGAGGLRTPRSGQARTRNTTVAQSHCSGGIFQNLRAVELWPPSLSIADQEKQRLAKQSARSEP